LPLEPRKRDRIYYAVGWIEYNGRPIAGPYRKSTESTTEAGARDWIAQETEYQIRKHLVGEDKALRFLDALELYDPDPKTAARIEKLLDEIGEVPLSDITGAFLKSLGPKLMPDVSVDTWLREIITPVRAVVNNAHELKRTPYLKVRAFKTSEVVAQDTKRGKTSRVKRVPATRGWIEAFCREADPYNAALVRFMFETAARIDQAISVKPAEVFPESLAVSLKAQKGHPKCLVAVSPEMMDELTALKPKRPRNRKTGGFIEERLFGYGSSTGYNGRWKTICNAADIPYLSAHAAGRHGFYTELVVRQGVDPVTAAEAGRWSDVSLPLRVYAHSETDEAQIRALFRTKLVQLQAKDDGK
jgi:integrase